jgi:hypothetical protein
MVIATSTAIVTESVKPIVVRYCVRTTSADDPESDNESVMTREQIAEVWPMLGPLFEADVHYCWTTLDLSHDLNRIQIEPAWIDS